MADDGAIAPGDPREHELLLEKREELVSMLKAVRHSLAVNNQPRIEETPLEGSEEKGGGFWDRRKRCFTPRGDEKCMELFEKYAPGDGGAWGFFEFKAYLEAVGRPQELPEHIGSSQEAFRCYCADAFGTDLHGGLEAQGFKRYRESIELKYPIEYDLLRAGIPLLPQRLEDWRRHSAACSTHELSARRFARPSG